MSVPPEKPTYSICQSQQQTSELCLDYYRNYSGTPKAGPPRQGDVKETFPNSEKDLHKLLWKKHDDFLKNGYSSLIGKIATERALSILRDNKDKPKFETLFESDKLSIKIGLAPYKTDIIARTNSKIPSYNDIINEMKQSGEANSDVAYKILANLSKNYLSNDPYEIFKDLPDSAKKLMALLICETIRFQENGACARMAMRMVINEYKNGSNKNSPEPFERVFVTGDKEDHRPTPYSIFAISSGGASRMRNQFYSAPKKGTSDFANDEVILKNKINNISDDEGASSQNNGSNNSTLSDSSTTSIPYRRTIGTARRAASPQNEGDLNEDVLAGKPSPNHKLPCAKPNSESKLDGLDNSKGSSNEKETQHEFGKNHTQNNDNDSMEPSSTINNNVSEPQPITSFAQNGNEIANFPPPFTSNSPGDTENDNDNYREEEARYEFDENQAHTSDHEEEHNDSMGPSTTVNNGLNKSKKSYRSIHEYPVMPENEMEKMIDDLLKNIDP